MQTNTARPSCVCTGKQCRLVAAFAYIARGYAIRSGETYRYHPFGTTKSQLDIGSYSRGEYVSTPSLTITLCLRKCLGASEERLRRKHAGVCLFPVQVLTAKRTTTPRRERGIELNHRFVYRFATHTQCRLIRATEGAGLIRGFDLSSHVWSLFG